MPLARVVEVRLHLVRAARGGQVRAAAFARRCVPAGPAPPARPVARAAASPAGPVRPGAAGRTRPARPAPAPAAPGRDSPVPAASGGWRSPGPIPARYGTSSPSITSRWPSVRGRRGDLRERHGDVVLVPAEEPRRRRRRCSWARMPSYLSSIQASSPTRRITSSESATGVASMKRIGRPRCSAALPSASSRARTAASPGSPTSISARRTSAIGRSKAAAIASSSNPSRSPIRISRDAIRPTKRASSGDRAPEQAGPSRPPGHRRRRPRSWRGRPVHRGQRQPPPASARGRPAGRRRHRPGRSGAGRRRSARSIGAGGGRQRLALLHPTQAQPVLGAGQRTAGEEGGGRSARRPRGRPRRYSASRSRLRSFELVAATAPATAAKSANGEDGGMGGECTDV